MTKIGARFPLLGLLFLLSCTTEPSVQTLVDQAIVAHGGAHVNQVVVDFDFRGRHFQVMRNQGQFQYVRTYTDSLGAYRDVLHNDGLFREINGTQVALDDALKSRLEGALNSVVYFALLPHFLNDDAVQKRALGEVDINGQMYDQVEVTFHEEGGGRDFEDRYVYWFNQATHTMDYLAYTFEVNGGGARFRAAENVRTVGGIRFADYRNYNADAFQENLEAALPAFLNDDLPLLSEIRTENVRVRPL